MKKIRNIYYKLMAWILLNINIDRLILSLFIIIIIMLIIFASKIEKRNESNKNLFKLYQVTTTTAKTEKIELSNFELKADCEVEAIKLDKRLSILKIEGISYNANDRAEHGVILAINYVRGK